MQKLLYTIFFFFINHKSLINFLRLNSSVAYQLLVGTDMEIVNSGLNTAPTLVTLYCVLQDKEVKLHACMYIHMHGCVCVCTYTLLEITHDVLLSECTMYYLTLVGEMDYL
jgi:hypothetical protein